MADVSNSILLTNFILLTGLVELYYSWYLTSNFLSDKKLNILKNKNYMFSTVTLSYYFLLQLVGTVSLKVSCGNLVALSGSLYIYNLYLVSFILALLIILDKYINSNSTILLMWLLIILNFTIIISDLLSLLLVLELLATIYYFFFINTLDSSQSIIKLKNLLINYLWLSFLTLVFYCVAIIFMVKNIGTLNFIEINMMGNYLTPTIKLFLFISIFWKLGVNGFQFFKLELYQYLPVSTIFIFSIFSIVVNSYILFFISINLIELIITFSSELLFIIVLINIIILMQGINSLQFFQFIAISGLNTLTTIILFTLV